MWDWPRVSWNKFEITVVNSLAVKYPIEVMSYTPRSPKLVDTIKIILYLWIDFIMLGDQMTPKSQ